MDRSQFPKAWLPPKPIRRMAIAAVVASTAITATSTVAGAGQLPLNGCTPDVVGSYLDQFGADYVLYQTGWSPEYATRWEHDEAYVWQVYFDIEPPDGGCRIVAVPDVVGLPLADAMSILDDAGFSPEPDAQDGVVIDQLPLGESLAEIGEWVGLTVQPAPPGPVPPRPATPATAPPGPGPQPPTPAPPGPGPGPQPPTPASPGPGPQPPTPAPPGPGPQPPTPEPSTGGGGSSPLPAPDDTPDSGPAMSPAAHRSQFPYAWAGLWALTALALVFGLIWPRHRRPRRQTTGPDVRVHVRRSPAIYQMTSPTEAGEAAPPPSIRAVRAPALVTINPTLGTTSRRRQPA